jgi:hypothetical protein
MRRRTLLALFPLLLLGAAPAKPDASSKKKELALELTFMEHESRQNVVQEKLVLALDAKNADHSLSVKGVGLEGWKARTLAREVNVNGKANGYWVEVTLFAADGSEAGYLAATLPRDPAAAFSAATKVKAGKVPLDAVLTRAP